MRFQQLITVLAIFALLIIGRALAQPNGSGVIAASKAFDKALLDKDSVRLKHLLSNNISYGHSNGWLQTKKDIIADLFSGKLIYTRIDTKDPQATVDGQTAWLRADADVDATMNGKPVQLKLKVLQVWVYKNKHWELFARQSAKAG